MRRRDFLIDAAAAATAMVVPAGLARAREPGQEPGAGALKGFIVSDAHFGWRHEQQPAPEQQREMMGRIIRRFPDLDLFIDTGDAHHSGADDQARGLWTDIIAGGCAGLPFYYVAGNHEIVPTCGLDPEWRCNRLGSVSCRPYYSFDFKGIHLVSLPELERAVLINREAMEWLALDLEVHKDRTVLILSHNNILGTTCPLGAYGYRGLANSPQMLALLDRYPNVIGWLNGHNHTYEVLERDNRLYVSNGRIGGFIPPALWGRVGQGHLGGIYFEVTPTGLTVRSYSATGEAFLDELGETHLSARLETRTTLDTQAPPTYCYGAGGSRDRQRIPVIHHHATGRRPAELFIAGADDASFNDDPDFALYQLRIHDTLGPHAQLMGASVQMHPKWHEMWVENTVYEWLDPGVRFLARQSPNDVTRMTVPLQDHGRATYYRCPPGRRYRATLDIETPQGGQRLRLQFMVHDRNLRKLATVHGPVWTLNKGRHKQEAEALLPDLAELDCIYNNASSNNVIHLMVLAEFSNLSAAVTLHRFGLALADAEGPTRDPAMVVDGKRFEHQGELTPDRVIRLTIPAPAGNRTVYEPRAKGNRRLTWLVRHRGPDWQVRNAPVADQGDHLHVGPLRNNFSNRREIVIAPLTPAGQAYVHRLRDLDEARVYPLNRGNRKLRVEIVKAAGPCEVELVARAKARNVTGADTWKQQGNRLVLQAQPGSVLELDFS